MGVSEKLLFLFLQAQTNSCGVALIDTEMSDFVLRIQDSEAAIESMSKKKLVFFDPVSLELYFYDYLRFHNPTTSTPSHRVKYKSDHSAIKSKEVRKVVDAALELAKKIAEKPAVTPQIPHRHHIDQ